MITAYSTEIPRLIPFQGHLTQPKKDNPQQYEPVVNGQYSILFTLYTAPVGGESKVWGPERHEKVIVVNGLVNVMIGSVLALPTETEFFARPLYVGITIDADGNPVTPDLELVPRQVLLPAMYAHVAGFALSAKNTQTAQTAKTLQGEVLSNILTAKDSVMGATGYDRDLDGKVDYANIADKANDTDKITGHSPHWYMPVGSIISYWGINEPTGWLICNGQPIPDGTQYDELRTLVSTLVGNTNTPDLRGVFLRGLDQGRGYDPGRPFGSYQGDDLQSHVHTLDDYTFCENGGPITNSWYGCAKSDNDNGPMDPYRHDTFAAGGSETRPKNIAVNYIIKY